MSTDHDEPLDEFVLSRRSGSTRTGTLLIAGDKHLTPSPRSRRACYYPEACPRRTRADAAAAEQVR